jgi:type II secretory pathway component GspD/PulD (secretin)
VLGGLIQDDLTEGEQRVPFLGRIPLIGEFFRVDSSTKKVKTNLMVFIKPTILRDGVAGGLRDQREVQLHARPAGRPESGKGAADARRDPAHALPPIAPAAPPSLDLRQLRLDAEPPASPATPEANGSTGQPAP